MKNEQEWVSRVRYELDELSTKRVKLGTFLSTDEFDSISAPKQRLLRVQFGIMGSYAEVLRARLDNEEIAEGKFYE